MRGVRELTQRAAKAAQGALAGKQEGQGLVEYGLILASVFVVVFGAVRAIGIVLVPRYSEAAALFTSR